MTRNTTGQELERADNKMRLEGRDVAEVKSKTEGVGIKARLQKEIMIELDGRFQVEDDELKELINSAVESVGQKIYLPLKERIRLQKELYDSFRRLDILQELVDDPKITEIMVNGRDDIFLEQKGAIAKWEKQFESTEQLEDLIQQIVSRVNRTVNLSSPIADARLEDGSRVHVVLPPVAIDGPVLTIRKFPDPITMDKLTEIGSITREAADYLKVLVEAGYNMFVSGGTGSGKTTFLNALSEFIPEDERIITIEDSAELQIRHIPNLVRLETRNENGDGSREISIGDLIRASLRMRPDRILVGEVRGKEALEMLQAMNTGHDGSISTGHGNSPKDMVARLETMVLMAADIPLAAVRSQIASAIEIMVHLGRLRDKSRKVLEIAEVRGYEDGQVILEPIFKFRERKEEAQEKGWGQNSERTGGKKGEKRRVAGALEMVGEIKGKDKLFAAGLKLPETGSGREAAI